MFLERSIKDYLAELSSDSPVPGGGGTSALVAALGMALEVMVARIALRKLDGARKQEAETHIRELELLMNDASHVVDSDPEVYERVMDAYRNLKNAADPNEAQVNVEKTLAESYEHQKNLARKIFEAKKHLSAIGSFAKGSIRNDLLVARALLDGAFTGAYRTALINVVYFKDPAQKQNAEAELKALFAAHEQIRFE